jgi:hypothetical protein
LETASKEIIAAQKDLEERRTAIRNLEDVIREKETTIQQLSARREELENNVKELQQTEASLRIELEDSRKELAQVRATCSKDEENLEKETEVFSDDALIEFKRQVEEDYAEEIIAKNKNEAEKCKQFIFQSFASVIKSMKLRALSVGQDQQVRGVVTPFVFPSEDAMKMLLENITTDSLKSGGISPEMAKTFREQTFWYDEECYNALLNKEFQNSLVKHLSLQYQLTVTISRWIVWRFEEGTDINRYNPGVRVSIHFNDDYPADLVPGQRLVGPRFSNDPQILLFSPVRFEWIAKLKNIEFVHIVY